MIALSLLVTIATFFIGIRSNFQSLILQDGRTCAARPYEWHSVQFPEFDSARRTVTGEVDAVNVTFTADAGQIGKSGNINSSFSYESDLGTVDCSTGNSSGGIARKKSKVPQSETEDSTCDRLHAEFDYYAGSKWWQMAYDTAKQYIMTCPTGQWYGDAFFDITFSVQQLGASPALKASTLSWLESVLYLNPHDPGYFCSCVQCIQGCIPVPHDTTPGAASRATNYGLAIVYWMIKNHVCDSAGMWKEYAQSRQSQYEQWWNDTNAYRLDTTLPPLDSISPGLEELLDKHLLFASIPENFVSILSNATVSPNPAGTGTVISFGISKEAYVRLELYDVLGHPVAGSGDRGPGTGYEGLMEPGNKSVPISLAGLPSGTYFARIQTAYGEVQSVKIVKE